MSVTAFRSLSARLQASLGKTTAGYNNLELRLSEAISSQTAFRGARYNPALKFHYICSNEPRVFVVSSLFFSTLTARNN